jgi:uncharacterized membrane protein YfcA
MGGLVGALVFTNLGNRPLKMILGLLLIATGIAAVSGRTAMIPARGVVPHVVGALSGFFGGIAGNQGGLRAGAMMSFSLSPTAFVATSTAVGLMVDAARTPIYIVRAGNDIIVAGPLIAAATVGVLIGTMYGERLLLGMSPERFRRVVGAFILVLGAWLVITGL